MMPLMPPTCRVTTSRASAAQTLSKISAAPEVKPVSAYRWGQSNQHCLVKTDSRHLSSARAALPGLEHQLALVPVR